MCPHSSFGVIQADSGAPLVCYTSRRWTLHGIASWGEGCAEPKHPGIYVRVNHFMQWITGVMGGRKIKLSTSNRNTNKYIYIVPFDTRIHRIV